MSKITNKKGFTLIELVIVLAIAALILVGILLAVHGAQVSRQNGQRKNDAGKIGADLEAAASDHDGAYPTQHGGISNAQFVTNYTNQIQTPDGTTYTVTNGGTYGTCPAPGSLAPDTVHYALGGSGGRQWQVAVGLDNGSGGAGDVYCATSE